MTEELEKYILDKTSPEDSLLNELYRKTHTSVINPNMVSGHLQGKVLKMLVSMIRPSRILEIGTYTGYSAIAMASAMQPGTELHTIEKNDELYDLSSEYINRSGFAGRIIMHTGNALEIIPRLNLAFDLIFIDGNKREYSDYYRLVRKVALPGAFILADNVLWDGKVTHPDARDSMTTGVRKFNDLVKNDPGTEQLILPLRDGLMLIRLI